MIISASRRTDIPAFYSEWFLNRLKQGYVLVRQPRNIKKLSRVELNPQIVDCIVFWTKNPQPMLGKLPIIKQMGYNFYFQFTLTPYDKKIEPNLPNKKIIIETFKQLSNLLGKEKVIWRYDTIIISKDFTVEYHLNTFTKMVEYLRGYTDKCIISFVDLYRKNLRQMKQIGFLEDNFEQIEKISEGFSLIAKQNKIELLTCSEKVDLTKYNIQKASCIDKKLIEQIIGYNIIAKKETNQRENCNCMQSIDIGSYDTCEHGCLYCYANNNKQIVLNNIKYHDKQSELLIGKVKDDDITIQKSHHSLQDKQIKLFD